MPLLDALQTPFPTPCPLWQKSNQKNKAGQLTTPMVSFLFFIAQICYCNKMWRWPLMFRHAPSRCISNLSPHAVPSPAEIPPEKQSRTIDYTQGEFFWFLSHKVFVTNWCWPSMFRHAPSPCITNLSPHAVPSPAEIPPEKQSRTIDHTHGKFFDFLLHKYVFVTIRCWLLMFRHAPSPCITNLTPHAMPPVAEI